MNLNFSEEELQFQHEVRQFLAEKLPAHIIEGAANNALTQAVEQFNPVQVDPDEIRLAIG